VSGVASLQLLSGMQLLALFHVVLTVTLKVLFIIYVYFT